MRVGRKYCVSSTSLMREQPRPQSAFGRWARLTHRSQMSPGPHYKWLIQTFPRRGKSKALLYRAVGHNANMRRFCAYHVPPWPPWAPNVYQVLYHQDVQRVPCLSPGLERVGLYVLPRVRVTDRTFLNWSRVRGEEPISNQSSRV